MPNLVDAPPVNPALAYRPDIDGLRAVAVLTVMLFHLGTMHTTGGFVGVDVFFVISGYLISSIIFSEIAASRFSIAAFYERRIRRIFPALFAMFIVYTLFACVFLLPGEMVEYAKTMMTATISGSNFYLCVLSGYFDARNSNPLLHTWSLAVEEQFYILFPIFLVIVRRILPRRLLSSVIVLTLVSLILSAIVVAQNPNTAFYMPYTRAWELMLGTLVALGVFPTLRSAWSRNLVALAGMALILYSVFTFTLLTPFPGLSALLPCAGSAMIIGAGVSGRSIVYSVLSWRPLVFIGLISYSLYLWHWPVIMIYRMGIFDTSSWFERNFGSTFHADRFDHIVQFAISFVLAYLSWKYVELPFRKGRLRVVLTRRRLFALAAAFATLLLTFSGAAIASGGLRGRFSPDTLQVASFLDKSELKVQLQSQRYGECLVDPMTGVRSFNFNDCLHSMPGKKNYILLGDSHAAAIWLAVRNSLREANVMQVTVSACPSTVGGHTAHSLCQSVMDYIFGTYLPQHPPDALILESDWQPNKFKDLDQTLRWATDHGIRVIVVGCVPEYDAPLPRLLAYSVAWHKPGLASEHLLGKDGALEPRLRRLVVDKWHFQFVSLYDELCGDGPCVQYADANRRIPLMDDTNHLNRFGAQMVITRVIDRGEFQ